MAIRLMRRLARTMAADAQRDREISEIVTFLLSLTGELPENFANARCSRRQASKSQARRLLR